MVKQDSFLFFFKNQADKSEPILLFYQSKSIVHQINRLKISLRKTTILNQMMKKKSINTKNNFFSLSSKSLLFRFFFFFFFFFFPLVLSGQVFVQDNAGLYVSENVALHFANGFNKTSETHKNPATVYIAKAATIINLQKISNAEIAYLPKQLKPENTFVAKKVANKKANSKIVKTPVEKKYHPQTLISSNHESKTFFGKLSSSVVSIPNPTQDYKIVPTSTEKNQFLITVRSQLKIPTVFLNKKFNTNTESINSIRPPPCI